jgi:S-methyl-5-thioribose-1-phosphate isomerase
MRVGDRHFRAVWWEDGPVRFIDQRLLPHKFEIASARSYAEVENAIREMGVRGAPTIGVMAAHGLAIAARDGEKIEHAYGTLQAARPTAVNLRVGLDAVMSHTDSPERALEAARAHDDAEVSAAEAIGRMGVELMSQGTRVATHCNAGWLAAQDWGTALSLIYRAERDGKMPHIYAGETRPRLQGSRITAWELGQEGVSYEIVADSAMASLMRRGLIDLVITGADCIAANGDVANKIGTYPLALAAREHEVPFYVAAPLTTFDRAVATGDEIPIEERSPDEVLTAEGVDAAGDSVRIRIAPADATAINPAFDITPAGLVSGLISEAGIVPASTAGIERAFGAAA